MSEVIIAALITGGLGFLGVVLTFSRKGEDERERARLLAELAQAQGALGHLHGEAERYKAAYLGLLELMQEQLSADRV